MKKGNQSRSEINLTIIGGSMKVKGEIITSDDIRIDGKFSGILQSRGKIVVAPQGEVNGNVEGKDIVVNGKAEGEFRAGRNFHLAPKGFFKGKVETCYIHITEMSVFEGSCIISRNEHAKKSGPLKDRLLPKNGRPGEEAFPGEEGSAPENERTFKNKVFRREKPASGQSASKAVPARDEAERAEQKIEQEKQILINDKIRQIESL